jgi:3-hydroxyisobutyrate dehydrogenase-like beta-hydroxyacid dehydrogenase
MSEKRVGFVGIGDMGNALSKRLLHAGYQLAVWNRTKERTREIAGMGARVMSSPADVASHSDVIFIAVLGGSELEAVALGEKGALAGVKPNSVLVDLVTAPPDVPARVAGVAEQKDARYLRSPPMGSILMAAEGALSFIVSGDKEAYATVLPLLQEMGKRFFYVGSNDEAIHLKLITELMMGCYAQLMAEALAIAERVGLDWKTTLEVINSSAAANPFFAHSVKSLLMRDFAATFSITKMRKDLDYALNLGESLGVPLPVATLVRQIYEAAASTGKAELDMISLLLLEEELAGIKKN